MKLLPKIFYFLLFVPLFIYVSLPSGGFPAPPPDTLQSIEPGDTETPLRRAYFTNLSREEVIGHYKAQFVGLPTLRLNYPPEEAQTIIRDQTRSSYLEELTHPFRESLYINGFVPKDKKDAIVVNGSVYHQKITVRYVPSPIGLRLLYLGFVSLFGYFVMLHLLKFTGELFEFLLKTIKITWKK